MTTVNWGATGGTLMDIKKVGVVGCGLMGAGIAQVAVEAGYDTIVREQKKLIQAKRDTANQ